MASFTCVGDSSCGDHGTCFNSTLCRCDEGYYRDNCSQSAPDEIPTAWIIFQVLFTILYGLGALLASYRLYQWINYMRGTKQFKYWTVAFIHASFIAFTLVRAIIFYAIDPYGFNDLIPSFLRFFAQDLDRPTLGAAFVFLFLYWLELYNTVRKVKFIVVFRISAVILWGIMFALDIAAAINLSLTNSNSDVDNGFNLWYSAILVVVLQLVIVVYGSILFYLLWKQQKEDEEARVIYFSIRKRGILLAILALLNIIGGLSAISEATGEDEGPPDNSADQVTEFYIFKIVYAVLSFVILVVILLGFAFPPQTDEE